MMQELITAANAAGLFRNKVFGRRIIDEWTMLLVVAVQQIADENTVTAEFLDSPQNETTKFVYRSVEPFVEVGDFINAKGNEISFLHKPTLTPITFFNGNSIVIPEIPTEAESTQPQLVTPTVGGAQRLIKKSGQIEYSREPMTELEMLHFNSPTVSLSALFGLLEPLIKSYARGHTRKPVDVALRLNAEGYKTACSAPWTPRLVYFLLKLMFNDADRKPISRSSGRAKNSAAAMAPPKEATPISMHNKDELAKLLSSLGRVTMKH